MPQPRTRVVITGYDYLAYNQLNQNPDLELEVPVRLGELDEGEFEQKINAGQVKYWQDGVEIPVDMVPENAITPDTVATLDADGTLHVLITPEVTGTQGGRGLHPPGRRRSGSAGRHHGRQGHRPFADHHDGSDRQCLDRLESYNKTKDYNGWDKFWASVRGESTDLS